MKICYSGIIFTILSIKIKLNILSTVHSAGTKLSLQMRITEMIYFLRYDDICYKKNSYERRAYESVDEKSLS